MLERMPWQGVLGKASVSKLLIVSMSPHKSRLCLRGISARGSCISLEIRSGEATEASLRLHAGRSHLSLAGVTREHSEALSLLE
jgi:hypothetical protein